MSTPMTQPRPGPPNVGTTDICQKNTRVSPSVTPTDIWQRGRLAAQYWLGERT